MGLARYDEVCLFIGSNRLISHNLTPTIPDGIEIGSVTVEDVTDNDSPTGELTIGNVGTNSASYVEDVTGDTVASGKAARFTVETSRETAATYLLKITATTSASPAETIVDYLYVRFL